MSAPKARQMFSLGREPQEGRTEFESAAKRRQTDGSIARSGLTGIEHPSFPGAHAPGYESDAASRLEFAGLAKRPNPRPQNPYFHVTGTPGESKEIDKENKSDDAPRPLFPENRSSPLGGDHGVWSTTRPQQQPQDTRLNPLTPTPTAVTASGRRTGPSHCIVSTFER